MKIFLNKIMDLLRKASVRRRLILGLCIMSILPLLLFGWISYRVSSGALVGKISQSNMQSISMAKMNIVNVIERLESNCIDIALSSTAQTVLRSMDTLNDFDKFKYTRELQNSIAKQLTLTNFVSDVVLADNEGETLAAYGGRNKNMDLEKEYLKALFQKVRKAEGKTVFTILNNENAKSILMLRRVNDLETGEGIGYILLSFDEVYLQNICLMSSVGEGTFAIIVDNNNVIITSCNPLMTAGESFVDPQLTNSLFLTETVRDTGDYSLDGKKYLITYNELIRGRWYMISFTPYTYLNHESRLLAQMVTLLVILFAVFSLCIAVLISKSINNPLKIILGMIDSVNKGELTNCYGDTGNDEIALVNASFNEMIANLRTSLEYRKRTEKEKRDWEFKALMAQINPHFLSNTLNNVKWMAEIQGAGNIVQLTEALIHVLQATMNRAEWVTVAEEVHILQDYITIQEYRYMDKFTVEFDISTEAYACIMPRFILQPLVENAIIHGIAPKDGEGIITIAAQVTKKALSIAVADDGIGMEKEDIQRLLEEEGIYSAQYLTSIGIHNTNSRIKLLCGEDYGLRIRSVPGEGTEITIQLPAGLKEGDGAYVSGTVGR